MISQDDTAGLPTEWKRENVTLQNLAGHYLFFLLLVMPDSYLPDLYFEPPRIWTDAPLSVALSYNPDKHNIVTLNVLHQVKLESGSESPLPEGMQFAAHSWLLFIASFDFLPDLEADF